MKGKGIVVGLVLIILVATYASLIPQGDNAATPSSDILAEATIEVQDNRRPTVSEILSKAISQNSSREELEEALLQERKALFDDLTNLKTQTLLIPGGVSTTQEQAFVQAASSGDASVAMDLFYTLSTIYALLALMFEIIAVEEHGLNEGLAEVWLRESDIFSPEDINAARALATDCITSRYRDCVPR